MTAGQLTHSSRVYTYKYTYMCTHSYLYSY